VVKNQLILLKKQFGKLLIYFSTTYQECENQRKVHKMLKRIVLLKGKEERKEKAQELKEKQ
jgi:hypothetical protein